MHNPKPLKFQRIAAQGELSIRRLHADEISPTGSKINPVDGLLIVGHSETGHHHVVDADCATLERVDEFTTLLNVIKPTNLKHLREFDTHPPLALQPGMYEFRTGREFDPFAAVFRMSQD